MKILKDILQLLCLFPLLVSACLALILFALVILVALAAIMVLLGAFAPVALVSLALASVSGALSRLGLPLW